MLDRFQEGRTHIAIVSRMSREKAKSVKKAVHKNLTRRLLGALGGDSSSESSDSSDEEDDGTTAVSSEKRDNKSIGDEETAAKVEDLADNEGKVDGRKQKKKRKHRFRRRSSNQDDDLEKGDEKAEEVREKEKVHKTALEQTMPADAVLSKQNAEEYLASQAIDPSIMPLGIITLEDVLEGM